MGYSTEFTGRFHLNRPLQLEHARYLHAFADTRRVQRDAVQAESLTDRVRAAVGLPVGVEGGYVVVRDPASIANQNDPPRGQPGLYCQWRPSEDQQGIVWDGGEKFYYYVQWLEYLIEHFLAPWGYVLNGEVRWEGESFEDAGVIRVVNNRVATAAVEDDRDPAEWGEED